MGGNFSIDHLRSQRRRDRERREEERYRSDLRARMPLRAAVSASKQIVFKRKVPNEQAA